MVVDWEDSGQPTFSVSLSSALRISNPILLNLTSSPSISKQLWSTSFGRVKLTASIFRMVSSTMPRLTKNIWSAYEVPPLRKLSIARVNQNRKEAEKGSRLMTWTILLRRPALSLVHRSLLSTLSWPSGTCKHGWTSPLKPNRQMSWFKANEVLN